MKIHVLDTRQLGHAGIVADDKANGSEVGRHLLGCPCADLRLTDQPEQQPRKESAMNRVVVHDQGRAGRASAGDVGEGRAHCVTREVHDHAFPDPAVGDERL